MSDSHAFLELLIGSGFFSEDGVPTRSFHHNIRDNFCIVHPWIIQFFLNPVVPEAAKNNLFASLTSFLVASENYDVLEMFFSIRADLQKILGGNVFLMELLTLLESLVPKVIPGSLAPEVVPDSSPLGGRAQQSNVGGASRTFPKVSTPKASEKLLSERKVLFAKSVEFLENPQEPVARSPLLKAEAHAKRMADELKVAEDTHFQSEYNLTRAQIMCHKASEELDVLKAQIEEAERKQRIADFEAEKAKRRQRIADLEAELQAELDADKEESVVG